MARLVHIANGTCTTAVIAAASIPGTRSIWADPLYEGPVPGGLTDEELLAVRARFLDPLGDEVHRNPANDMRAWRRVIADHASYDELVLWYEHDLFDQLNLIQLLPWIRAHVPASKTVSLVSIGSFPERPAFRGLGELTPAELASLFPMRTPVTADQYATADAAWAAFREPAPQAIDALRRAGAPAMPFLAPALERFLQEYPWTTDGLTRTERRLLQLAASGRTTLAAVFPRMHDDARAYYVTDLSLMKLSQQLADITPALLTYEHASAAGSDLTQIAVMLTDAGQDVLAGRLDRVAACGIDRWLGGVHLEPGKPMWRWDQGSQNVAISHYSRLTSLAALSSRRPTKRVWRR